jgi:hypothetical protein
LTDKWKENLEHALSKQNEKIDYSDLSSFFYHIKTDQDLDLFLKGMKLYQLQQKELDPRFAVPLMKLFYVSNRADKALDLFMSKVNLILLYT